MRHCWAFSRHGLISLFCLMRLRCVSEVCGGWSAGREGVRKYGWYSTQCAPPQKDPPRLPLVPSHMLLLLCGRVHESSCCPYLTTQYTFWPRCGACVHASSGRRLFMRRHGAAVVEVWGFGHGIGMGMAEVTRDDGTAASAQGPERVWAWRCGRGNRG